MADGSVVIDTELNDSGVKKGLAGLSNIAKSTLKGVTVAVGTVATAFTGLVTASVSARGEIEQQIGGVETLFKNSANKVIENANRAYETAGMSASEYMQNVTSFSASLLQSVAGDTDRAADLADMAMQDMSDNANKMGTSMEAITNAYQGFAKQNYTMLDNLKLGYGGTKTEMERLLADAEKITGVKYDISHLNDVYTAIHVVQGELGITGTTAKEASETLQGSLASAKSAWQNFLSGAGDLGKVVKTVSNVVKNIIRIVSDALPDILENITDWLPDILEAGGELVNSFIQGMSSNFGNLISMSTDIVMTLINGIVTNLPQIISMGVQAILMIITGIADTLPELVPAIIEAVVLMFETLLDNIDMLIDAGIQLILGLAEGLIEALPKLIDKIPVIIEKLLSAFTENLPKLVEMGITLLVQLALGLIRAIPQLISKIPQIISAIATALKNGISSMIDVGKNLIQGLWDGIKNSYEWIKNKIKGWVGDVMNFLKNLFGIHSPSKLFKDEIGLYLGLGLGEGFTDSLDDVYKDMRKAVDTQNAKLTSNLTTSSLIKYSDNDRQKAILESIDNNREIAVNSTIELDGKIVANAVNKANARQKLQYGIA